MTKSKEEKKSEESRLFMFSSLSILAIVLIVLITLHIARGPVNTADSAGFARTGSALAGMAHQTAQPYGSNLHTAIPGPCSDTDGGKNFQKYGRVSGIVDGKRVVINDECINSDTLKEAYCLDRGSYSVPSVEYASCSGLYGKSAICVRGRCTR